MIKFISMKRTKSLLINLSYYILLAIFIGILVGVYQLGITFFKNSSNYLYSSRNVYIIIATVLLVIALYILNIFILKFNPFIIGSGVPNVEFAIRHNEKINYKKGVFTIILNSYISTLVGFPLGSEGPSVCLGAMSGSLFNDLYKKKETSKEDLFIASGAGFAAAFLSPLSGFCYIFEEFIHEFKIKTILKAIFITSISVLFTYLINKHHLLSIEVCNILPINNGYIYIPLFIINILISYLFMRLFIKLRDNKILNKYSWCVFILVLILNYLSLELMGSGLGIMSNISKYVSIIGVVLILLFRFIITLISGNTRVTGGLVVPTMCLGTLSGQLICLLGSKFYFLDPMYFPFIILISTCMIFGIINKVPFTATSLVLSTIFSSTFDILLVLKALPILLILFISSSFVFHKLFKFEGLYDEIIKTKTRKNN